MTAADTSRRSRRRLGAAGLVVAGAGVLVVVGWLRGAPLADVVLVGGGVAVVGVLVRVRRVAEQRVRGT